MTIPDIKDLILNGSFIAFDVEGDGHKIASPVEFALVEFDAGEVISRNSWLINPGHEMDSYVQKVHGITDAMLIGAPTFPEIAEEIRDKVRGRTLVAHDVANDLRILETVMPDLQEVSEAIFDSFRLAKSTTPGFKKYNLISLAERLSVQPPPVREGERTGFHSAEHDAELAGLISLKLADLIPDTPKQRAHLSRMAVLQRVAQDTSDTATFRMKP